MESNNKETCLILKSRTIDKFADTDNLLRSGVHVQNHHSQSSAFRFIVENFDDLEIFYQKLYQARLRRDYYADNVYYYLDYFDDQKSKLKKKSLDAKETLFAIYLYTLHKVEKRFSTSLSKEEVYQSLITNPKISPQVKRLFLGNQTEETITSNKTIIKWIDEGLRELKNLGWIYSSDNTYEDFEILPAFERIVLIYKDVIFNIEELKISID